MIKQIFINLPVSNTEKSVQFYTALGFTVNPEFTDDNQKCMVWSEHIYAMLQSQQMFRQHIKKQMPDTDIYQTASYTLIAPLVKDQTAAQDHIQQNSIKLPATWGLHKVFAVVGVLQPQHAPVWSPTNGEPQAHSKNY